MDNRIINQMQIKPIFIFVASNHQFFPMAHRDGAKAHSIAEHRLVMAQHLGRCLKPWEVVHHINRNNRDNRLENLLYQAYTILQIRVKELEDRVTQLEAENVLLKHPAGGVLG
jgi:hypothetical protein